MQESRKPEYRNHKQHSIMKRETVTGNKALAGELGVSSKTVQNWKKAGVLRPAILSEFGRTIIYDLDKVYYCLNNRAAQRTFSRYHK